MYRSDFLKMGLQIIIFHCFQSAETMENDNEMIGVVVIIWPFLFCIRLGNLGKTEPGKLFRNFKWLKNREDGSDFDDFGLNESQCCQLKFENWAVGNVEKLSQKVRESLPGSIFERKAK